MAASVAGSCATAPQAVICRFSNRLITSICNKPVGALIGRYGTLSMPFMSNTKKTVTILTPPRSVTYPMPCGIPRAGLGVLGRASGTYRRTPQLCQLCLWRAAVQPQIPDTRMPLLNHRTVSFFGRNESSSDFSTTTRSLTGKSTKTEEMAHDHTDVSDDTHILQTSQRSTNKSILNLENGLSIQLTGLALVPPFKNIIGHNSYVQAGHSGHVCMSTSARDSKPPTLSQEKKTESFSKKKLPQSEGPQIEVRITHK